MSGYVRKITPDEVRTVISDIGFDKSYIENILPKYRFALLKISDLTCPQANIFKQVALSVGADAAVHREVITCKIEKSDILLGATDAQLKLIANKLKNQPFGLSKLADLLLQQIVENPLKPLKVRDNLFDWTKKTYIMGILNVTPDSFSDGGKYLNIDNAIKHAVEIIEDGVDIIDIGGESTRPFSQEVLPEEEMSRIIPVIKEIRRINKTIPISVDTRHSMVADEALTSGADIINDVSGFDFDSKMIDVAAKHDCPVILMHSLANPDTMQVNPEYEENIIDVIYKDLESKVLRAVDAGIKKENIIIDPGIGFGKTLDNNLEIIRRISEFTSLGCPILVGVSRKSVINKIIDLPPEEREEANIALASYLAANGTNILRVHDVKKHFRALTVFDRLIRKN